MTENWRVVREWTDFEVSSLGRIRSYRPTGNSRERRTGPRLLECMKGNDGYLRVTVSDGKREKRKKKTYLLHRLVALTLIDRIAGKGYVNHKNGVKHDNRVANLEWVTWRENCIHAQKMGLTPPPPRLSGTLAKHAKLNDEKVRDIRERYGEFTQSQLASEYKVTPRTILDIVRNKTWKHILEDA